MTDELLALFSADKREHANQSKLNTPEYRAMRARDLARRERVMELIGAEAPSTAEDYYHAAWIMNHGDTPDDARRAHQLALRASELGYRPARWLAAASYDRWRMYLGKPQKYGTNYLFDGRKDRLWDVDPRTTDKERAAWGVPPLAEQLRKAAEANRRQVPLTAAEAEAYEASAPEWAKAALRKWQIEDGDSLT